MRREARPRRCQGSLRALCRFGGGAAAVRSERDIPRGGDPARREEQIERQTMSTHAIALEWAERSGQRTLQSRPLDVAIIVTKSDKEPGLATSAAARRFFRQYAVPLDDKIRRQADAVQYFPLSAIGQAATIDATGNPSLSPAKIWIQKATKRSWAGSCSGGDGGGGGRGRLPPARWHA